MNKIVYKRMDRQTNRGNHFITNDGNIIQIFNTSNTMSIPKISFKVIVAQKLSNAIVEQGR